jgi:hypothetical protein
LPTRCKHMLRPWASIKYNMRRANNERDNGLHWRQRHTRHRGSL